MAFQVINQKLQIKKGKQFTEYKEIKTDYQGKKRLNNRKIEKSEKSVQTSKPKRSHLKTPNMTILSFVHNNNALLIHMQLC